MKILIIEDDKIIARNLEKLLTKQGYLVDKVYTGIEGLNKSKINDYDLIILDWMLPDINGDEVCDKIRKSGNAIPIIFLTAKDQIEDKIEGLDIGADDYISKPFIIKELLARVRVLLRRNYNKSLQNEIKVKDISIDTSKCEVICNGEVLELSPKLYSLLQYLAYKLDSVVSREELLEHLWDENADLFSNVLDVHIKNLRKELSKVGHKELIKTIKTKGYMLCSE